jgi:hypothetical protein
MLLEEEEEDGDDDDKVKEAGYARRVLLTLSNTLYLFLVKKIGSRVPDSVKTGDR